MGASADVVGGPKAMQSYANAERGLRRVNQETSRGIPLAGMFGNRWVQIGSAVLAAAPLLVRTAGSLTQLVASLVQAAGGAGVIGGGALGAFIVGLGSVMLVMKGVTTEVKNVTKAYTAYTTAVRVHGAASTQAARAQQSLNVAVKAAPAGTLALVQNVKALKTEWEAATKQARGYIITVAAYAANQARGVIPQVARMVNQNVGAVAGQARTLIDRMMDPGNLVILERISAGFRRDLPPAADAMGNLMFSFGRLVADAQPFVRQFLVGIDQWTKRLDVATRDTRFMHYEMAGLVTEFRNWLRFLGATWNLLREVFHSATLLHTSLHGITGTFTDWTRWLQDNPLKVARFFQNSSQAAGDLGRAVKWVIDLFALLYSGLDPIWQALRGVLTAIGRPLLDVLTQLAGLIGILGQGFGSIGGPVAILLRTLAAILGFVDTLLSRVPMLGTVLAGALAVYGIMKMVQWMRTFVGGTRTAATAMTGLTAQTNAAAAATERLAVAERLAGGGIGFRPGATTPGFGAAQAASMAGYDARLAQAAAASNRPGLLGRIGGFFGNAAPGARFAVGPGGVASEVGILGRLGTAARLGIGRVGLGGAAGGLGIAALLASTGISMVAGGTAGRIAGNIGTGAAMGAMAGSFIPGIGTGIGAGIGALGGGVYSLFQGGGGDPALTNYQRAAAGYTAHVGGHMVTPTFRGQVPHMVGGQDVQRAGLSDLLGRWGGDNARTASQVAHQLAILRRFRGMLRGDRSQGAQQQAAALDQQIQLRSAVLPGLRQHERHAQFTQGFSTGQGLMRGYNIVAGAQGPEAGMEFVRKQALARWAQLGPEGKRVLANGLLSWAQQMRHANPAFAGEADKIKNSVIGRFVDIKHAVQDQHGQIFHGTQAEWKRISKAMTDPVEAARQQVSRSLTQIQRDAVESLRAMGLTPAQASKLVLGIEATGSLAAAAATAPNAAVTRHRHGPSGGPGGSSGTGSSVSLQPGISGVASQVMAMFPGLSMTSGVRPGDKGSYHAIGEAVDLAGPPSMMNQAAAWIAQNMGGSLLEGIHQSGLSIKNGAAVAPSFWGASTWNAHANHIHLAAGNTAAANAPGGARGNLSGALGGMLAVLLGMGKTTSWRGLSTDATGLPGSGASFGTPGGGIAAMLASLGAGAGASAAAPAAPGSARALGQQMAAARGWTGTEWNALDSLWQGESGWNPLARNPSSGAFGIPQSLPASKMGAKAVAGDAAAQIGWGLAYIAGRYHTPSNAYNTWLGRSPHWYGTGGDFIAKRPQLIGVGDRGAERVTVTPVGRGRVHGLPPIQVTIGRIDATGQPGAIREMVRGEIRDAIADVASEMDRTGYVPDEGLLA